MLTFQFLFSLKNEPSDEKLGDKKDQWKEQLFSKTQNVSEQIKNEILPLMDVSDEDVDDLDDEVAMISNKKSATSKHMKLKDLIFVDDIKVEVKEDKKQSHQKANPKSVDEDETRNFNTLPRNYSDPRNQGQIVNDSSYNDVDFSSNMLDQQFASKELYESNAVPLKQTNEEICDIEAELLNTALSKSDCALSFLKKCVSSIKISGFKCNMIHAITNLSHFINQSFFLKQKQRIQEAQEYDLMSGILMISTKRYTQAMETFRKIQSSLLKDQETEFSHETFEQCAILELLIVESMSQPNQLSEKLQSLERMNYLLSCKKVKPITFNSHLQTTDDPFSILTKILPQILNFTVKNLLNEKEIVRMAALKLLSFILETQGCSLDNSMVYILKTLLQTYPEINNDNNGFARSDFSQSVNEFLQIQNEKQEKVETKQYKSLKLPTSGFFNAMKNAFNQCLDIYMSVLSSISSHILHQLFYEIVLPTLTNKESLVETKVFSIKIAEKIITICQGDLILKRQDLEFFLDSTITKVALTQTPKEQESLNTNIKSLWQSIRTKVFTNYSQKGLKTLVDWLVYQMTQIAQNSQNNVPEGMITISECNQDISKLEISDEENQKLLQLFDIVSMISVGRKNNEVEANTLIKIKQDFCLELYLLINPLLFWLDFSVEREERFPLFKQIYSTIKDVLENLPPKRVDIDLIQILIPILQRTTEFLKSNSPSLQMLKFLDIVLRDLKQGNHCYNNPDLQFFFLEMLNNLVNYISYCLYEEIFAVFDKLISLCGDAVNEKVVTKCIESLVDKYTIKSKAHKNSLQTFMKALMEVKIKQRGKDGISNRTITNTDEDFEDDQISVQSKNNFFEILCDFCFFNNKDPLEEQQSMKTKIREDFRSTLDIHDLYIDKLQFFLEALGLLTEMHVTLFVSFITHPKFKQTLLQLLNKGETSLRLKAHEFLDIVTNYYVQHCTSKTVYKMQSGNDQKKSQEQMEVEFINQERLYLSQVVLQISLKSLEQRHDSYLQFNSLILLDYLFQHLIPVPTYQNEIQRERINKSNPNQETQKYIIRLASLEIREDTPEVRLTTNYFLQFEVTALQYLYMRVDLVLTLWPQVQIALNSPWSNIRSICYGLICSMLKVDLQLLQKERKDNQIGQNYAAKLKEIVLPMLESLLSSKESESKAGGLNILGSFCGLSYDFSKVKISKNLEFFRKNSLSISLKIWQLVFDLQDDWDITIKEASVVLIQLCAPRDAVRYFDKIKKDNEDKRFAQMLQGYGLGQGQATIGDISSRFGSDKGRNDKRGLFSHSISSSQADDINDIISPLMVNKNQMKPQDITGLLRNKDPEEFKSALLPEVSQQMYLSGSEIFDLVGNTLNSAKLKEYNYQFDLDEAQKEVVQNLTREENFEFFVDAYSDEQIQEIISIFRNDFKPPKNLWIEKSQNTGVNGPDFYGEIFSQAIDQFNQQQLQLQQQQQQQQALMVNNGNKNKGTLQQVSIIDALEDDLVKKYEIEKNEKEKAKINRVQQLSNQEQDPTYKIFERHYEDSEGLNENKEIIQLKGKEQLPKDGKKVDSKKGKTKGEKKKAQPSTQLQLQILDESEQKQFKPKTEQNDSLTEEKTEAKQTKKIKTTDELIEEYERKISKTKQLLEEEKKKKKQPFSQVQHETLDKPIQEPITKSTPDFKQKKEPLKSEKEEGLQKSQEKLHKKHFNETQPRSFIQNVDNARLIKQINNCFNDNSFNNFNIGPVVMTANIQAPTKHKQKLNKSFENVIAAKQHNLRHSNEGGKVASKKNLSTSPRRGSSSAKKYGVSKSGNAKRKYLDQSYQKTGDHKVLYNMRDLNYFIKTIEKDLSNKFNKLNSKDFNSMPTTPTSILKKVEDQMKAITAQDAFSKGDIKQQMSSTCPNMAQVLSQIDQPYQTKHSLAQTKQPVVLSQLNMNVPGSQKNNSQGNSGPFQSSQHTPSNISNINGNLLMAQSQNSLSNYSIGNQLDKFSFSKTQKIDLKEANKNILKYQVEASDGRTARDNSNDIMQTGRELDMRTKAPKNVKKGASSKGSRGSQDKYLTQNNYVMMLNSQSSSSSQTKLNKSLNNISSVSNVSFNPKKKDQLSKSMIQSLAKNNNLSPSNKKLIQQMIKQQLGQSSGSNRIFTQQTPVQNHASAQNQYNHSSNMLYDYVQSSEQTRKSSAFQNSKTPVKKQGARGQNGMTTNFTEILEVSPSSGEKDYRTQPRIIY